MVTDFRLISRSAAYAKLYEREKLFFFQFDVTVIRVSNTDFETWY